MGTTTGYMFLYRKYRRGEIRGRHVLAVGIGLAAAFSYVIVGIFRPGSGDGLMTLLFLLPVAIAIAVIVGEYKRH